MSLINKLSASLSVVKITTFFLSNTFKFTNNKCNLIVKCLYMYIHVGISNIHPDVLYKIDTCIHEHVTHTGCVSGPTENLKNIPPFEAIKFTLTSLLSRHRTCKTQ